MAYVGTAAMAAGILLHSPSSSSSSTKSWAAWFLSWPLGSVALGLLAAGFLGVGVTTAIKAYRAPFTKEFDLESPTAKWLVPIGRAGHGARAIIFFTVSYFLMMSAYDADVHELKDMAGALNALRSQRFGMVLYTSVAIGLTCFGVFEFIQAMFRRVGGR
jgi:hypothetical protein